MKKFSDIIGQKAIIEHLYNALRTGSISHAYILSGDAGSGRKTIASIFATAMQCEDLQEEIVEDDSLPASGEGAAEGDVKALRPRTRLLEPCGRCLSCMQAESNNQPDIITITHAKPNSIGVEEIRRMRSDLQIKPYANSHKIYIIPDAEKLTIQAQNALLKTLEEPPEYAVIILIANGLVSFLPTVMSRCVVLQTRAVEEAQIAKFLQKEKGLPQDQAQIMARFAGGNPGQALLLTEDQEFMELRDSTVNFLSHLGGMDAVKISEFSSGVDPARRMDLLNFVLMWFHDVLLYLGTQNSENLIFQEDIQYIIEAASSLDLERIGLILDQVDMASRRIKSNVQADAVLEVMFLNIRQQYRRRF